MPDDKDEDALWERSVESAGPNAVTPWQTVRFEEYHPKCWANGYYQDGTPHGCFDLSTTDLGLCAEHYEELIGHA